MYLLLDVGNSRTKAVCYAEGTYQILAALTASKLTSLPLKAVYVSSVAKEEQLALLRAELGLERLPWRCLCSEEHGFELKNGYTEPAKLGVDRWLAMQGAVRQYPATDILVVDAGTAMTIDWVDSTSQHLGGWIVSGLKLQQQALLTNTARVAQVIESKGKGSPSVLPGSNTLAGVENGAFAAVIGTIRLAWQIRPMQQLMITGGDAETLIPHLNDLPVVYDPLLIFRGMARYVDNSDCFAQQISI